MPCFAPPYSTLVLTAGSSVLPTSSWRPSSVPEFPATMTGCRWLQRPQMADLYLLTMAARPRPCPNQRPQGPPNLIASPGGISAASESPSRQPGSSWLWLGKRVNWPELRGTGWEPGCQSCRGSRNEGVVERAIE